MPFCHSQVAVRLRPAPPITRMIIQVNRENNRWIIDGRDTELSAGTVFPAELSRLTNFACELWPEVPRSDDRCCRSPLSLALLSATALQAHYFHTSIIVEQGPDQMALTWREVGEKCRTQMCMESKCPITTSKRVQQKAACPVHFGWKAAQAWHVWVLL